MKEIIQCLLPLGFINNNDISDAVKQAIIAYIRKSKTDVILQDDASLDDLLNKLNTLSLPVTIQIVPISDDPQVIQTVYSWIKAANQTCQQPLFIIHTWKEAFLADLNKNIDLLTTLPAQTSAEDLIESLTKITNDRMPSLVRRDDKNFIEKCQVMYLLKCAQYYQEKNNNLEMAESLYCIALKMYKGNLQLEPFSFICILNSLSILYIKKQQYDRALLIYNKLLDFCKEIINIPQEFICSIVSNQGGICEKLGQPQTALTHYQSAYQLYSVLPDSAFKLERMREILASIAYVHSTQKAYGEVEKTLVLLKTISDANHPALANVFNVLAESQLNLQEYDRAAAYFQNALRILGATHPDAPRTINGLAKINQMKQAEKRSDSGHGSISSATTKTCLKKNALPPTQPHSNHTHSNKKQKLSYE